MNAVKMMMMRSNKQTPPTIPMINAVLSSLTVVVVTESSIVVALRLAVVVAFAVVAAGIDCCIVVVFELTVSEFIASEFAAVVKLTVGELAAVVKLTVGKLAATNVGDRNVELDVMDSIFVDTVVAVGGHVEGVHLQIDGAVLHAFVVCFVPSFCQFTARSFSLFLPSRIHWCWVKQIGFRCFV